MDDLIKKLESAECGSRELDKAIETEIGSLERWLLQECPLYTASLDAALALAPEKWRLQALEEAALNGWRCRLSRRYDGEIVGVNNHEASTGPIALCIAALKARQENP